MSSRQNGGRAFPRPVSVREHDGEALYTSYDQEGMTLRQWYAGQAVVGSAWTVNEGHRYPGGRDGEASRIAKEAFRLADAMLKIEAAGN